VLQRGNSYDEIYRGFRWDVPARLNMGVVACDRHADGTRRLALIYQAPDGRVERFTFDDLKRLSNRCANALAGFSVRAGDRVGVLLPQRPETVIAQKRFSNLKGPPYDFELPFDRARLQPDTSYSLQAMLTDTDGHAEFATDTRVPVNPASEKVVQFRVVRVPGK